MKKLSLKTYCLYHLKRLSKDSTLNVKKLDMELNTTNYRLYAPLLVWCFYRNQKVNENSCLYVELEELYRSLKNKKCEESALLDFLGNSNNEECNKFKASFDAENRRRDETEYKTNIKETVFLYQKKYQLSNYKLSKLATANPSNFNAFYLKNQNNKLSKMKCKLLLDNLFKEYGML